MFTVVTERRRRRVWTPRTVAASVGAHLLLLGVFVTAAESTPAPTREPVIEISLPEEPEPPAPQPTPPPAAPERPQPVKGDFVTPRPPEQVPATIPLPDPRVPPISPIDVSGIGVEGDVIGTPTPHPAPPTGQTEQLPDFSGEGPIEAERATVLPHLANEREAQRMLQRAYPPLLRNEGITGRTTVVLIIDREGNVEPGSVRVQETTHPGFAEAAVRAAERMRFTPAQLDGRAVSVVIALPIDWQLQN